MTDFNYQYEGLETINDFIRWGGTLFQKADLFFGHGTDNAFDDARVLVLFDLCTGSGCIGIASLQACEQAQVDLVDISEQALEVAQSNIEFYGLEGVATAVQSDLFSALEGRQYDLIVSNPPYVDEIEMSALPAEFQQEPELGLAAGTDGLDLVRKILAQAANYLKEDGTLIVEVGVSQFYLEQAYPELPLYWFEFEQGGEGVFAIQKSDLEAFQDILDERAKGF
jgi:ribosomal protein L3 glutamine methyltransferase